MFATSIGGLFQIGAKSRDESQFRVGMSESRYSESREGRRMCRCRCRYRFGRMVGCRGVRVGTSHVVLTQVDAGTVTLVDKVRGL